MKARARSQDLSALEANADEVAALLRALGNSRRLMILCMLIEHGECSAGELSEAAGLSPSAASQHLAKMRDEGLVECRREAQNMHYRVADARTTRLISVLKDLYCK
jgi:DNA-binding transcriptional ArsR family regulator